MTGGSPPGPPASAVGAVRARAARVRAALGDPPAFDLALAGLLAALTVSTTLIHGGADPVLVRAAALVVGPALAVVTIWRRVRPELVLVVLSAAVPIPFLLGLPVSDHMWFVAVYTVFAHRPWRAALRPFAAALAVVPVCAATRTIVQGRPWWPHLGDWAASLVPLLLAAAALGLTVAADRTRAAARRAEAECAHRAESLARHRARIAEDVNAVVAVQVREIAARARELASGGGGPRGEVTASVAGLDDVRRRARDALGTVRPLLERLREPQPVTPPLPGPPSRRPWWCPTRSGLGLVGALAAAVLLVSLVPGLLRIPGVPPSRMVVDTSSPTALALLAVQLGAFAWWRSAPVPALLVNAAATTAASVAGVANYLAATAPVLLYYTAGAGAPLAVSAGAVVVALGARVGVDAASGVTLGTAYAVSVTLAVAVWMVGAVQGRAARRTRRDDEARRSARRRDALAEQRHRITRELHDLVGHHLSAVAVQAGVLRRAAERGPVEAESLRHLADSAEAAESGLPTVTGVVSEAPDLGRLTAAAVESLVVPLRAGGLPVTVDVRTDGGERGAGETDLFARRIVQEALTNVIRHGGSAPTAVEIVDDAGSLSVSVRSAPPASPPVPAPGTGQGLAGMRERADLLGGSLHAGPCPEGGWRVRALLPRRRTARPAGLSTVRRG